MAMAKSYVLFPIFEAFRALGQNYKVCQDLEEAEKNAFEASSRATKALLAAINYEKNLPYAKDLSVRAKSAAVVSAEEDFIMAIAAKKEISLREIEGSLATRNSCKNV